MRTVEGESFRTPVFVIATRKLSPSTVRIFDGAESEINPFPAGGVTFVH
jgi:hypothetical protein